MAGYHCSRCGASQRAVGTAPDSADDHELIEITTLSDPEPVHIDATTSETATTSPVGTHRPKRAPTL